MPNAGGSDIWDVPANNLNIGGFLYSQVPLGSLTWNVDPTGSGSTTSVPSLTTSTIYSWSVRVSDSNNNQLVTGTWYQP